MSYASDALLKQTAEKVAQLERIFSEFRIRVDELNAKIDRTDALRSTVRSNRAIEKVI